MKLVSEQVKLLLDRMDTHPEEFVSALDYGRVHDNRWSEILQHGTFTFIEKGLLKSKYTKLKRESTRNDIINALVYQPDSVNLTEPVFSTVSRMQRMRMGLSDENFQALKEKHRTSS